MIRDPYKNKERWIIWKEKTKTGIPEISTYNSNLILQYLNDMEKGINISSVNKKGGRSYIRLNSLKTRIIFITKRLEIKYSYFPLLITIFTTTKRPTRVVAPKRIKKYSLI